MAENDGTVVDGAEGASDSSNAPVKDDVTLFKSRIAGLDAKVSELDRKAAAAEARAADAAQKLADYESGKIGADEALRAQVAAKDAELETVRREAAAAKKAVKFPETYAVFGDDIARMSEDKLAASEARLTGATIEDEEPPTPRSSSAPRQGAGAGQSAKPPTKAEVEAALGREYARLYPAE